MRIDEDVYTFNVRNIVLRVKLYFRVDLKRACAAAENWPGIVLKNAKGEGGPRYKPERFTGFSFAIKTGGDVVTFAIFKTGNGVATGLKRLDQIPQVKEFLANTLGAFDVDEEVQLAHEVQPDGDGPVT